MLDQEAEIDLSKKHRWPRGRVPRDGGDTRGLAVVLFIVRRLHSNVFRLGDGLLFQVFRSTLIQRGRFSIAHANEAVWSIVGK